MSASIVVLKSREFTIFVHNFRDSLLYVYRGTKNGANIDRIHVFKRGSDLVTVNEASRWIHAFKRGSDLVTVNEASKSIAYMKKRNQRF